MRPSRRRAGLFVAIALGVFLFSSLGVWQLERRDWKHTLIAEVEARVHRAPVAAPAPAAWHNDPAQQAAYLPVRVRGRWIRDKDTLVLAVTHYGRGYWVLSPFVEERGFTVLVNRGFVPEDKAGAEARAPLPDGEQTLTGLLRLSEPARGFLRRNDPAADRWYARQVEAIAEARGLHDAAPYFIDRAGRTAEGELPMAGLTVVTFRDDHLVYALTWFALAAGLLVAGGYVWRLPQRD